MKTIKFFKRTILPVALSVAMLSPATSNIAIAQETNSSPSAEKIFIPFRDQIPFYLSQYSSYKSEIVKQLWTKIFYEELNWDESHPQFYDSKYSSWWKKYTGSHYTGLGGTEKILQGPITYSPGDFEAFLGNTLEANPEFLGQLLGLEGYAPLCNTPEGNLLMKPVICNYLSKPDKYSQYFVNSIIELTKDGTYLNDNSLTTCNYNNVSGDYYMLITLSSNKGKTKGLKVTS